MIAFNLGVCYTNTRIPRKLKKQIKKSGYRIILTFFNRDEVILENDVFEN